MNPVTHICLATCLLVLFGYVLMAIGGPYFGFGITLSLTGGLSSLFILPIAYAPDWKK